MLTAPAQMNTMSMIPWIMQNLVKLSLDCSQVTPGLVLSPSCVYFSEERRGQWRWFLPSFLTGDILLPRLKIFIFSSDSPRRVSALGVSNKSALWSIIMLSSPVSTPCLVCMCQKKCWLVSHYHISCWCLGGFVSASTILSTKLQSLEKGK